MTSQRTLSLTHREFEPSDYERLVQIHNENYPDYPNSIAEQRARDESIDRSKFVYQRLMFQHSESGKIVGFGEIRHVVDMFDPRKFMIRIEVDPAEQSIGVGSWIFQTLSRQLDALNAEVAWTINKEDYPRQRIFFQKRGFHERSRSWESRLDLLTFDSSRFQEYSSRVSLEGITFTT